MERVHKRKPKKAARTELKDQPKPLRPGNDKIGEAKSEVKKIEVEKKEEERKAALEQEKARESELATFQATIDQLISNDSETFLKKVKQIGGE